MTTKPLAEFSEQDIRDLFEILRYTQRDPRRLAGVLRLLRESNEIASPICEEGWHHAESMTGTHRRCVHCGHQWVAPTGGNPSATQSSGHDRGSEAL